MNRLSFEDSIRILLHGTCGINSSTIANGAGIGRADVMAFMSGKTEYTHTGRRRAINVDKIAAFVWKRINAHVLLTESDVRPAQD